MLLHPLQNTAVMNWFGTDWLQKRPRITQRFGGNPDMYREYGIQGHNGVDWGVPEGTPVYAPCDGSLTFGSDTVGYGTHVTIINNRPNKKLMVVLAHLSKVEFPNGGIVRMGELIGHSGNTGNSTGPHLHMTVKIVDGNGRVVGSENGFNGSIDFLPHLLCWKGTHLKYNL